MMTKMNNNNNNYNYNYTPYVSREESAAQTTQIIVRVGDAVRASIGTFHHQVHAWRQRKRQPRQRWRPR